MDDIQTQLIVEQISGLKENIEGRLLNISQQLDHNKKLEVERLNLLKLQIDSNRAVNSDHETRIRSITDAVIQNQSKQSIFQAGQAALTLIAAAIAAYLGSK